MKKYFLYIWYISLKDIKVEIQRKELLILTTIFSFTCVVIFNISRDVSIESYSRVLPGILWVTIFFTAVLGLNRFLSKETDSGNFESLLLLPISRDILFINLIHIPIILVAVLATLGISVLGTIIGSMTSSTGVKETLLPILLFPLIFPILLAAIEVTGSVLRGQTFAEYNKWIQLLAITDIIFIIICSFLFTKVMNDY